MEATVDEYEDPGRFSGLLDVSAFCSKVRKQQPPLIRLETFTPTAVQRLIAFSYLLFFLCIFLSLFKLPKERATIQLNGFCHSASSPELCGPGMKSFISRVRIPSNTEQLQVEFRPVLPPGSPNTSLNIHFGLRIKTKFDQKMNDYVIDNSQQNLQLSCPNGRCLAAKSPEYDFSLRYFVVQAEAQYNFLALAPSATDCMLYLNYSSSAVYDTFEEIQISLRVQMSTYLVTPVISVALTFTTFLVLVIWLHSFTRYKPVRHLPQRDWITMALVALLCYDNPIYAIWDLVAEVRGTQLSQTAHFWFQSIELVGYMLVMLWMLMMSTGIAATSRLPLGFYFPKVAFVLIYVYAYWSIGLLFAFQPQVNDIEAVQGLWIIFILGFQAALYMYIIARTLITWKLLQKLPYFRTRCQQLSFRVFLLQAILLFLSMTIQFGILFIQYANGGSLTNESTTSFNFIGRKIFLHVIVYVMTYCYLEPINEMKDNPESVQYREGQYVVHEADLHVRPTHSGRAGLITHVGNQMYGLIHAPISRLMSMTQDIAGQFRQQGQDEDPQHAPTPEEHNNGLVFCLETAAKMMNLAVIVYYDPPDYEELTLSSFGFQGINIQSVEEQGYHWEQFCCNRYTDTNAMVVGTDDRLVVVFRGTGSLMNLKTDLKANQIPYIHTDGVKEVYDKWNTKPRVHAGFWKAYQSIREQILPIVELQLELKARPVYFTGHSLGAALATLGAMDIYDSLNIHEKYGVEITVYNFGSPRVGNHAFAEYFDNRISNMFRVACDGDVVTGVPKHDFSRLGRHFFSTYKHVGVEIVLDPQGHGNMIVDPNFVEKKFRLRYRGSARSHLLNSYRRGFRGLQDDSTRLTDEII